MAWTCPELKIPSSDTIKLLAVDHLWPLHFVAQNGRSNNYLSC